jgi:hypothetical protein
MAVTDKSIFNAKEMVSGGVWISQCGDIFSVPLTHVRAVLSDPAKFGLTSDFVKEVYSRHGEGRGSEGDARGEIIGLLVSRGWIRIRYHPGDFSFHVELKRLNRKEKDLLWEWSEKVLSKFPERWGLKVVIDESFTGRSIVFGMGDLPGNWRFIDSSVGVFMETIDLHDDVAWEVLANKLAGQIQEKSSMPSAPVMYSKEEIDRMVASIPVGDINQPLSAETIEHNRKFLSAVLEAQRASSPIATTAPVMSGASSGLIPHPAVPYPEFSGEVLLQDKVSHDVHGKPIIASGIYVRVGDGYQLKEV